MTPEEQIQIAVWDVLGELHHLQSLLEIHGKSTEEVQEAYLKLRELVNFKNN